MIIRKDNGGNSICSNCGQPYGHVGICPSRVSMLMVEGRAIWPEREEVEPSSNHMVSPATWYDTYVGKLSSFTAEWGVMTEIMSSCDIGGKTFIGLDKVAEIQELGRQQVRTIVDKAEELGYLTRTGKKYGRSYERQLSLPPGVMPVIKSYDAATLPTPPRLTPGAPPDSGWHDVEPTH